VLLNGEAMEETDEDGNRLVGDTLFLLFNAHHESIDFVLPPVKSGEKWVRLLDTADPRWDWQYSLGNHTYPLRGRSVAGFRFGKLPAGE
jgi:glycogen operon protein